MEIKEEVHVKEETSTLNKKSKQKQKKKPAAPKAPPKHLVNTFHYVDAAHGNAPSEEGHLVVSVICSSSKSCKRKRMYDAFARLVVDINRSISNDGATPGQPVYAARPDGTCKACSTILVGARNFCADCGEESFYHRHSGASRKYISLWCGCDNNLQNTHTTCCCFETSTNLTSSPLPTQICSRDKMHLMACSKTLFFHIQPISSDMVQTLEIDRMITVDCDQRESQDLVVSLQHSGFLSQSLHKLSPSQREIIHSIIATSHVTRVIPSPPPPPPLSSLDRHSFPIAFFCYY